MNRLGFLLSGRSGRRLLVVLGAAPLIIAAIVFTPTLSAMLLGLLVGLLLIDAVRNEHAIRRLAGSLAADGAEPKLEVGAGALGDLCHQINRLLQQRRTQQRLLAMLPSPSPAVIARLAELTVPPEGLTFPIVVLAMKVPGGAEPAAADLQVVAAEAVRQAALHGALLSRNSNVLLMSFGALGGSPDGAMRSAYRAAFGLHAAWQELPTAARPPLCLTSGAADALVVPGLGYTLIGQPLSEAISLVAVAPADTLHCSEVTYLHLRRLGSINIPLSSTVPASRRQSYNIPFG